MYAEIYDNKLDSLICVSDPGHGKVLGNVRDEIVNAFWKGKISELHYNLLKEKISTSNGETTNKS